jgi:hypothetical protein
MARADRANERVEQSLGAGRKKAGADVAAY